MMYDSSYYQKKRKVEIVEQSKYKPKTTVSEDTVVAITTMICLLIVIVFLFVMLAKALEDGRIECESKGGEWHSTLAGKVIITSCDGIE